jgi:hypothetical protein
MKMRTITTLVMLVSVVGQLAAQETDEERERQFDKAIVGDIAALMEKG